MYPIWAFYTVYTVYILIGRGLVGLQEVDGDYAGDAVEHLHATIGEGKHQFRMGAQKVQVDRERLVVFFEVPGVVVKGLGSRRAPHGS